MFALVLFMAASCVFYATVAQCDGDNWVQSLVGLLVSNAILCSVLFMFLCLLMSFGLLLKETWRAILAYLALERLHFIGIMWLTMHCCNDAIMILDSSMCARS